MKSQRGFVGLAIAAVLVVGVLAVPVYVLVRSDVKAREIVAESEADLSHAARALEAWYERVATRDTEATIEVPAIEALGVPAKANWRIEQSDVMSDGALRYRKFAIWEQQRPESAAVWNRSTAAFHSGVGNPHRMVDGRITHMRSLAQTEERLKTLASHLQRRYSAKLQLDPLRDATTNHFRPRVACNAQPDELPCINSYAPAANVGLAARLGVDAATLVSAWGTPIEVANLEDSATLAPPYTMALRTRTPWGSYITAVAVQPIN